MMHLKYGGKADPLSSGWFNYRFGDPTISPGTVPATRNIIPQSAQPSKEAQAAFPLCPSHGRNNCHPGPCPSQHLSAPSSTSQAAADNMHRHLWPGLTADTVEHPPMCPLPPLQRNPPQARFHPQATRRAQIFAEYLDT